MNENRSALVISREYPPNTVGGTSITARNLSVGLTRNGWHVAVASTNPNSSTDFSEEIEGVSVHRIGTGPVYGRSSQDRSENLLTHRRIYRAGRLLVEVHGKPDVVLLPDIMCFPEAQLLANSLCVPLVNILGQDFRTLTRYDRDSHRVTNGASANRDELISLEAKAIRQSSHIVYISEALSSAMREAYKDLSCGQSVIHLGIDESEIVHVRSDHYSREACLEKLPAHARNKTLLVACGRLVPVKGFVQLIQAIAELREHRHKVHLAIIGVGPEESILRSTAAELGLHGEITFVGEVARREVLAWMSIAELGVVPSLWESFCYVCAEMMAIGIPVVASHVDSLRELLPTSEYGFPVGIQNEGGRRYIDPSELTAVMNYALVNRNDARVRAERGKEFILSNFTNSRFGTRMSELCENLRLSS